MTEEQLRQLPRASQEGIYSQFYVEQEIRLILRILKEEENPLLEGRVFPAGHTYYASHPSSEVREACKQYYRERREEARALARQKHREKQLVGAL